MNDLLIKRWLVDPLLESCSWLKFVDTDVGWVGVAVGCTFELLTVVCQAYGWWTLFVVLHLLYCIYRQSQINTTDDTHCIDTGNKTLILILLEM